MNPRRSFLALVGGLAIGGPVTSRAGFARPTLILPPGPTIMSAPVGAEPILTLQHIRRSVPEDALKSWMFLGLRLAKLYGGRDEQVVQTAIEAAVERHGGILAAMKAGAI